ncbi:hypothetical protein DFH09DRAFT_280798 [Mycena vulgaris]|nr:hypothetical protein DFH09DRAFT_280798 [Mycena vulgaris]
MKRPTPPITSGSHSHSECSTFGVHFHSALDPPCVMFEVWKPCRLSSIRRPSTSQNISTHYLRFRLLGNFAEPAISMSVLVPNLGYSSFAAPQARAREAREPPALTWIPSMPGLAPASHSPTQFTTASTSDPTSNPEHVPSLPAYSFYLHPSHPGILQSAASSTSSLAGSESSGGPSTPWWLASIGAGGFAGVGAGDAQPTTFHPEAPDEHGWRTTDALDLPFAVMRPHPTTKRRAVTLNSTAPSSLASASFTKPNVSASPAWLKLTQNLAARLKSLRRVHGRGASGDNSDLVYARVDSPSTASPSTSLAALTKGTATPPCASRFSPAPAKSSAAPTSPARSIQRTPRGEVKLLSGRMRRDPGRVDKGKRRSGEWAFVEGSDHVDEDTGLIDYVYTGHYVRL